MQGNRDVSLDYFCETESTSGSHSIALDWYLCADEYDWYQCDDEYRHRYFLVIVQYLYVRASYFKG